MANCVISLFEAIFSCPENKIISGNKIEELSLKVQP